MPTLSLIRIRGKFFLLENQLKFSQKFGYLLEDSTSFRFPKAHHHLSFSNSADLELDLTPAHKRSALITSPAKIIGDKLEKKVAILELNFDKFFLYEHNALSNKALNWQKLYKNDWGITKEKLFNTSNYSPIVPESITDEILHAKILLELAGSFFEQLKLTKPEFIIITGEMIWSSWASIICLTYLVEKNLTQNSEIIIDYQGVWHSFLLGFENNTELYKLNEKYFKANLKYIFADSRRSEFLPDQDKLPLFKKDQLLVLLKHQGLPSLKIHKNNERELLNYFAISNKPGPANHKSYLVLPRIRHLKRRNVYQKQLDNYKQRGRTIAKNSLIINTDSRLWHLVAVDTRSDKLQLFSLNGEYIKKGQVILKSKGLLGGKLKAPVSGKLDLNLLKQGLIRILVDDTFRDFDLPYSVKLLEDFGSKVLVEEQYYALQATELVGSATYGVLANKFNWKADSELQPKVIYLDSAADYDLDLEVIEKHLIKAVVIGSANYQDFKAILERIEVRSGILSICLLEELGTSTNAKVLKLLKKNLNSYVEIKENWLNIFSDYHQDDKFSHYFVESRSELGKIAIPIGNQEVKIVSYQEQNQYARIEFLNGDRIYLNDGHEVRSHQPANLIFFDYE